MINSGYSNLLRKIPGILIFLGAFFCLHGDKEKTEKLLVGIWQDSPVMASGWGEAYQFFPDGKFILNHNQMDCGKRELSLLGTWSIEKAYLILKVSSRKVVKGGKKVKSSGSCASEYDIEGGQTVTENLPAPKKIRLKISNTKADAEFPLPVIGFDKQKYWKLREDPKDYQ